jgi:hypothetical protein
MYRLSCSLLLYIYVCSSVPSVCECMLVLTVLLVLSVSVCECVRVCASVYELKRILVVCVSVECL